MSLPPVIRDAIRLLFLAVLEHQYVVLFGVVAIEEAGVPLPAPTDVVIAFYGYRARGHLPDLAQVVLVCALASTVGTLVPYFLARRFGPNVAHRLATWIDVDPAQVDRWTERIHRRGFIAVVVGRLIPGARVVMSLVAGTARVPVYQFSPAVFIAASIYWTFWVTVGVAFGPTFRRIAGPYITYVLIALPLVVITFFVYRHLRARRKWASRPTPRT
jgi:membrane protein DedA with SNARE-associated domain